MVPEGWQELTIGECLIHEKAMAYGILQPGDDIDGGVPMLRTVDIGTDGLCGTRILRVSKELHGEYKRTELFGGEVILSVMGTVGRAMVVPPECAGWNVNRALAVMRLKADIDAYYFCAFLKSPFVSKKLIDQSIGSAQKRINLKDLKKYKIRIPQYAEQTKIAQILSAWDKAIATTEKLIENSSAQKKALMQQLLTGKKRLPGFDEKWCIGRLGDFLDHIIGGGTPSRNNTRYWEGDIPWVTVKDMISPIVTDAKERVTQLGLNESAANLIPAGNVIIATRMAVGRTVMNNVNVAINQDLKALVTSKSMLPRYLFYWLIENVQTLERLGTGSTVKGIRLSNIRSLKIRLPSSLCEQAAIVNMLEASDRQITVYQNLQKKLLLEKSALMQQLLTGKRRVRVDQDAA